jgi:pimeloyl-ACP methyl ester carboxylesterase
MSDDAVTRTPPCSEPSDSRLNLTVTLRDGRILGYAEYGVPDGLPVFGFHGTPGSRLMFRIAHEAAVKASIRLIAPERPGFGISSRHPGRDLRSYADDIAELASLIGIDRFAVAGVSGGGPYAAACAAYLKDRINALAQVSPIGPVCGSEKPDRIGPGHFFAFRIMPRIPPLSALVCGMGRAAFLYIPQMMYAFILSRASTTDWRVLSRPEIRRNLLAGVAEGCRPSVRATMQELAIFSRPWCVPFAEITAPAVLWQGLNDRNIPVHAAARLGELIPDCEIHLVPDAGHYWIFDNMETVLGKIAGIAGRNRAEAAQAVTKPFEFANNSTQSG